jgi:predicted MFS family arabinose efflux permease
VGGLLVIVKLNITRITDTKASIRRVDFLGASLLGTSVVAIIMLLDRGGHAFPWVSPASFLLGGIGLGLLALFVWVETRVATEPIFDLRILSRPNVASSYTVGFLQITSQLGMLFSVPLYFQVTQRASATVAGGHLVPAVVGNTVGGLLAGNVIRRTGRYKTLLVIGGLVAAITHLLLFIRWNGNTNLGESLYIIPGGMGTGIASASAFVAMTSLLEPQDMAMATSGYMLLVSFAMTTGITMTNTVLGLRFKQQLEKNLHCPGARKVRNKSSEEQ